MIQIEDYKVLTGIQPEDLVRKVTPYITLGWICNGGVVIDAAGRYVQSIVKPVNSINESKAAR